LLGNSVLTAQLGRRQSGLTLLQDRDGLLFTMPCAGGMAVPRITIAITSATVDFTQNDGSLQASASFNTPGRQRMDSYDSMQPEMEERYEGNGETFGT
jgi:hypothetical protein